LLPYVRPSPLIIIQGCTFVHTWEWIAGGKPVDLTGAEFELVAKSSADNAIALIHLTTANGGITVGGNAISLRIEEDFTRQYAWRNAIFDLRVKWPGAEPRRVDPFMTGRFEVRPGVLA
jgi:hypothetical protein